MLIDRLWLKDFRSYSALEVSIADGTCVVLGPNGAGKSNLLEAVFYAGRLSSFRGAPSEAMVARDADSAVVRGAFIVDGRETLVEAELTRTGRNRVLVNKQRLARTSDLASTVLMTVFAPTDLELIKGGPALRRAMVDDLLVSLDRRNGPARAEFERSLRQRNALLKQVRGRLDESAATTLDVWDMKLSSSGEELAGLRRQLVDDLVGMVGSAYGDIAGHEADVHIEYVSPWSRDGLAHALAMSRADDVRRGVTLIGPHRDDVHISLEGMPSRTHASQGEQRTLALALRLAGHRLLGQTYGTSPILLLDDVFSELDDRRSEALLASLPVGQRILTTAVEPPTTIHTDQLLVVDNGRVEDASS